MRKVLLLAVFALCGCAASPYAEVGVGYKVKADWWMEPEHGGGRNPTAHIELGLEFDNGYSCAYSHWSHYRDGGPFNDRPETYKDEILCQKRWGGK